MSKALSFIDCISIKLILIFFLFVNGRGIAQFHDHNWILGQGKSYKNPKPGGSNEGLMQFNFQTGLNIRLDTNINNICYMSYTCSSISDEKGNLVAYTDGHNIFDDRHQIMLDGDTINPGNFWQGYLGWGYPISDGAIFLPIPKRNKEYLVLHKRIEFGMVMGRLPEYKCDKLYVSQFKYDTLQKRYVTWEKNRVLLEGEIAENEFAVCKHGNGIDYWVVARKIGEPLYYFFLIDSNGVTLHHEQRIGTAFFPGDLNGNMIFNRQENQLARVIPQEGIEIFDFDRCLGKLFNPSLQPFLDTFLISGNCAFSPSGKYLYVNSIINIYQYEVKKRFNPNYIPIKVGEWDSILIENTYSTLFFTGRLALDDKIYFSVFGTNGYYMHTLHKPEEHGKSCDFRNHDFLIPNYMDGGLPFFPNFRNGILKASACDTATISKTTDHLLYTNLWQNNLRISSSDVDKEYQFDLIITNLEGKLALKKKIVLRQTLDIGLENLIQGMYILHILENNEVIKTDKIVLTR